MKNFSKYTINLNSRLIDAIYKIQMNNSREVIVILDKKVVGILSEGDILRCILKNISLHTSIKKHFNKNFKFLNIYNKKKAKNLFYKFNINLIPILSSNFQLKNIIIFSEFFKNEIS